ncbi:MAG: nucleoside kinase [Prevotellaceae bacterium]|nr:nucleoside kinase [Prevotellaceae bacterium]
MEQTVTIFCKNNQQFKDYPRGTSLMDIYRDMNIQLKYPIVAARVNYKVEDLNFLIYKPKDIDFIDASTPSGMRVYLRSISMVMAKALNDLNPEATLRIEHPICRGYYCCIDGRNKKVSPETITALKKRMQEIIAADMPIVSEEKQTPTVIEMFRERGEMDKVILLETLGISYARFVRIGDFVDYYNGVLVPSTSYVPLFDLQSYSNGILLRVPDRHAPDKLAEYEDQSKMFDVFNEFVKWNKLMDLSNVGDFNLRAREKNVYNMIKISEALHERKIVEIADMIHERQPSSRFIMISGPSSSGKTTFSKRLSVQLMVAGLKPIVLSLDNYFVNRVDTPLDENGEWDFEALHAVDLELFNTQLTQLLNGEEVEIPFYNFEDGKRYFRGEKIRLNPENVLVIEGIHALNPELTSAIPRQAMFKIYVSTLTTISLDNHNWIPTTDTRLLRRIVRDFKFRGFSARESINRWPSVRRGEEKWIFPFQEQADAMFNSALMFELAVLRKHAEPIIADVPQYCEEYTEAHRLLKFLKYFTPIHDREIPPTSLLREFLGGSSFKY